MITPTYDDPPSLLAFLDAIHFGVYLVVARYQVIPAESNFVRPKSVPSLLPYMKKEREIPVRVK